jgi:hypothetical protein
VNIAVCRGRQWWRGAGALVLALSALACTEANGFGARARAESAIERAAAPTAEEAVRLVIEADGAVYAGDCAATRSPQDVGKVCSKLIGERNGLRAYLTGRTFSEFSTWIFVEQTATGWQPAGSAPLDFFATSIEIPWPR